MYKNSEGYLDVTAGSAMRSVSKEEKKREADVQSLIKVLKQIISLTGFELINRIELKDKETGKEYK